MIEQLTSLLSKKGPEISLSPGSLKPAVRLTSEREHIHQLKVMKNEHPAFFPPNKDDNMVILNYEGIAVIELQLPLS